MSEETQKEAENQTEEKVEQGAEDAAENAGTAENTEKEVSPEEKIAALEKEIEDLKKEALYKAAENDNWRKRMMQQKEEAVAYANASLLNDLLESLDNFDRTLDAAKDAKDAKTIADGIKMISKNLVSMLENKYGLSSFGKEGDEFNPEEHEAIGRVEDEKAKKETLQQVYMKGYKLNGKIIRNAKVMVSVPIN
ncbi:MAG: nucleotide exchange factor GrpE [Spirochaetia bacterium]|nr:nucleotide exchange factor GrpE [Treponema sp.]MCI6315776.1 nucleotide exchange factor GrpE [Spirochaetia bacterium]MBR0545821.1 nucleotide exchange factor GrpE [Treponema sp.]MCI6366645.1 nucleotide exchange factor GrpE [Spirochaetia bacterium]MCI6545713.1 nucleotide exchange factor GrpE [Spirochaetia bacterium]